MNTFLKLAYDYGCQSALQDFNVKYAALEDIARAAVEHPELTLGGAGALGGAGIGALTAEEGKKGRGALVGAGVGGATGAGLGAATRIPGVVGDESIQEALLGRLAPRGRMTGMTPEQWGETYRSMTPEQREDLANAAMQYKSQQEQAMAQASGNLPTGRTSGLDPYEHGDLYGSILEQERGGARGLTQDYVDALQQAQQRDQILGMDVEW